MQKLPAFPLPICAPIRGDSPLGGRALVRLTSAALRTMAVLGVGMIAVCGDGDGVTEPDDTDSPRIERLSARLGIAALAVAAGSEGRGFFDNYLACPRRGVIDYSNTAAGRRVTFSGCDLGDAVVVDGRGELRWTHTTPVSGRAEFCDWSSTGSFCATGLQWQGSLTVTVDGSQFALGSFTIDNLSMVEGGAHFPDDLSIETGDLGFASMRVTALQRSTTVSDASLVASVFDPVLSIAAIANPANDLAVLTEADLKRVALQGAMELFALLFFETLDFAYNHTHDLGCGTSEVSVDGGYPEVVNRWSNCESAGTYYNGTFTVAWDVPRMTENRLAVVISGGLTLGGGVPRIALDHVSWSIEFADELSGDTRISGVLRTATASRPFDFRVVVDD